MMGDVITGKRLHSFFKLEKIEEIDAEKPESDIMQAIKESPRIITKPEAKNETAVDTPSKYIGPIAVESKLAKVRAYFMKKQRRLARNSQKGHCYLKRRTLAQKRIRIKGRFVSHEYAK